MNNYIIKDADGNEVNRIIADLAFVQANFEHYEEFGSTVVEPTAEEIAAQLERDERMWRDSELVRTDALAILPDYPNATALTTYRQALRDWPASESFPDTRPTLGA